MAKAETKFGPWKIADDDHRFVLRQNGTGVARVAPQFNTFGPDPNAERNFARLIAAAPDLYAALRALLDACELQANRSGGDFGLEIGPAAELAEVALSRVEQPQ